MHAEMIKIQNIKKELNQMESKMKRMQKLHSARIQSCHPAQKISAINLIHYLTLRNTDIRDMQDQLHETGLSSLASSESHILRQIQAIQERLGKTYKPNALSGCHYLKAKDLIIQRSENLFGTKENAVIPYVMVTFDRGFIDNFGLITILLRNGMNIARINCAHDDEKIWTKMIQKIRKACKETGKECKIYMDLAGPKIRTLLTHKGKNKGKVEIKEGDLIWLSDGTTTFGKKEIVVHPNEKGIVECLLKHDRVYIDDGLIKGKVETIKPGKASVRITRVSGTSNKIKNGKGINFPDSVLNIPSLTDYDIQCLPFICANADLVGYSFVRYPSDVEHLQHCLENIPGKNPDLILKIETPEAVQNLPLLLLQGMHNEVFGIMIARGDLAVEIGFERMGEIQEEILWICEAAHVPVIWATQVLENLNKSGMATRSEITDAAHAAMAECVMINKGDYTIEVIDTLKEILTRMGGHHVKKRFTFRPLSIAANFFNSSNNKESPVGEFSEI
jgi:pyruvate kinase